MAMLARHEANRYLRRVLQNARQWCDPLLVLDDQSTDATAAVAREEGAEVRVRSGELAWGRESEARAELWSWAVEAAGDGWVLFQDADMLLMADPRSLCQSVAVNAWAWPLRDLWDSEDQYRVDPPWQGHLVPRVWLVRPSMVPAGWEAVWEGRGLHCGHIPPNFPVLAGVAPTEYVWHHLAYVKPEDRVKKHAQYLERAETLTPFELAHAESILER